MYIIIISVKLFMLFWRSLTFLRSCTKRQLKTEVPLLTSFQIISALVKQDECSHFVVAILILKQFFLITDNQGNGE